ncbi:MAG: hypothetical protein EOP43_06115 [Sphingobacteriaceae bacterium]|nr:MAG: hypothetical protein EOP43_06115 [Sphingobacteriaceae bacterium]
MDELEELEMIPTGQQLVTEIAEYSQLLRNYYETGDPMATGELFHLLVLKYVTNEQIRETIREISLMDSTIDPSTEL